MKGSKKMAEAIRLAAKDIEEERVRTSCFALQERCDPSLPEIFARLFSAKELDSSDAQFWLDSACDSGLIARDEKKLWRVTALCFFAAMAESGDLEHAQSACADLDDVI